MKHLIFVGSILIFTLSNCSEGVKSIDAAKSELVSLDSLSIKYNSLISKGFNVDSLRGEYAYEIAQQLTKKYGYDIYGQSSTALVGGINRNEPVLDFYCDWFNKRNIKIIFEQVKAQSRKLGFYSVVFFYNPKTTKDYGTHAVGGFDTKD